MAKQKSGKYESGLGTTDKGGSGGPPGKKQRRKVRRNSKRNRG
jgi:hypothetical protein